ncbi:MAG: HDOD domain-containing protein [candidate division Zixibacteria bacterium]|nr:HDOD domain-containing protein [candidate division Zixibacteria bacterium]
MTDYQTSIGKLTDLPSMPTVISKLHSLMNDPDIGTNQVAAVVGTDAALVARTLKLVNSPFYGFSRRVTSIDEAIAILGVNALHQLVMTTAVFDIVQSDMILNMHDFWLHSFGVGVFTKHLLPSAGVEVQNNALMCGILHDIGRLVLARSEPSMFSTFYFDRGGVTGTEEEIEFFGVSHQQLGEMLAQKWNFPDEIIAATAYHHKPDQAPAEFQLMVSAINIADVLCHTMHVGSSASAYLTEFFPSAWQKLELNETKLENVLKRSLDEIDDTRQMLGNI